MTKPTPVISVPTNVIEAVAKWTSTDPSIPHLHQVLFTKGTMVALDGHRMVIAPCETFGLTIGVDRCYLLAAVAAQRAMKVDRPHLITIELVDRDPQLIQSILVRLGIGPADGQRKTWLTTAASDTTKFPPYQQVIESNTKAETESPVGYALNPAYLAAIAEVHHATAGEGLSEGVKAVAWTQDRLGPLVFESSVGVKFLVMPMRI